MLLAYPVDDCLLLSMFLHSKLREGLRQELALPRWPVEAPVAEGKKCS